MVSITTLKPFYDRKCKRMRNVGEVFADTPDRAREIADKLPGYVSFEVVDEPVDDYDSMPVKELRALARERGVKVAANASKSAVIAALRG